MFADNLLKNVHSQMSMDKAYAFEILFPDEPDTVYQVSKGPGRDPCPFKTWFPVTSVREPVGQFVNNTNMDFYMTDIPIPTSIKYQNLTITFVADIYKHLEFWFERWYETISNGGRHMGTLHEVARPLKIYRKYNNTQNPLGSNNSGNISSMYPKITTYYVIPSGEIQATLDYTSTARTYNMNLDVVGKIADERVLYTPKVIF